MLLILSNSVVEAQQAMNLSILSNWDDNSLPTSGTTAFNDVWGYAQSGREYAIVGTIEGFRIFDITDPTSPTQVANETGSSNYSLWRDFKTYGNYLYAVADQGASSTLQIYDLSSLPGGISKVYDSNALFSTCHNIFIDESSGRLYAAGTDASPSGVIIADLKGNPTSPSLLANFALGAYTHDVYVHQDTLVAYFGNTGVAIFDFADLTNPSMVSIIFSYTDPGYAHSGWCDDEFETMYWCTETQGTGIHISDFTDGDGFTADVESVFRSTLLAPAYTNSVAHNPIIRGNYLFISYYHDGLQIYDITNRMSPQLFAYYDTHPQNTDYAAFKGSWGVYPFLPSGNIITTDTENGLFVLATSFIFPVEMSHLQAEVVSDAVRISWTTTNEVNNDRFVIERSEDGENFVPLFDVKGHGTTDVAHDYEAFDYAPLEGQSFYRLVQLDRDGTSTESEVLTVNRERTLNVDGVYPNPALAGQEMVAHLDLIEALPLEIIVTDLMGRIMYNDVVEGQIGYQNIPIPAQEWSAGNYLVKINAGDQSYSQKVVINH